MWRSARTAFAALVLLLGSQGDEAKADAASDSIARARALAARCEISAAIAEGQRGLDFARRDRPPEQAAAFHHDLASWFIQQFRFDQAASEAQAALALISSNRGGAGTDLALAQQNLGVALTGLKRFDEAAGALASALDQFERRGPSHRQANVLLAIASLEAERSHFTAALRRLEDAAKLAPRFEQSQPMLAAQVYRRLADAYQRQARPAEARRALERAAGLYGARAPKRLSLIRSAIASEEGRFADALAELDRAPVAALAETSHCDLAINVDLAHRRALIRMYRREISEARQDFNQSLALLEHLRIDRDPRLPDILKGFAQVESLAGAFDASHRLFDRAAAEYRRAYGGQSAPEAMTLVQKAFMLQGANRGGEAAEVAEEAIAALEGIAERGPLDLAHANVALGTAYQRLGRLAEAEEAVNKSQVAFAAARGASSFDLPPGLVALAEMRLTQNRPKEALPYLDKALRIQSEGGAVTPVALGITYARKAQALAALGDSGAALAMSAKAVAVLRDRIMLGEERPWADAEAERRRAGDIVKQELELLFRQIGTFPRQKQSMIDRALASGQLGASLRTGQAIAQMADRFSRMSSPIGELVRQRQDLITRWRSSQDALGAMVTASDASNGRISTLVAQEKALIADLRAIDARIDAIDSGAGLLLKSPVASLAAIRPLVQSNEAVLSFFVADNRTYAVVITRTAVEAYAVDLTRDQLERDVRALRALLIPSATPSSPAQPFPDAIAHRLYRQLILPARSVLGGKTRLIIVPDGPLMSIPLDILLTGPVDHPDQGSPIYPWLIRDYSLEVVPSLAAFVALRRIMPPPRSDSAFLGVGAPVLARGSSASANQSSANLPAARVAQADQIRALPSLPEARGELERLEASLSNAQSRLLVGPDATEPTIRSMPLDRFAILAFATHGLVAGELVGYGEPALVLTTPADLTDTDDGLLSASEVATLRLKADWVILSACNTAASDGGPRAEPFTGLVKAFFYAGARTLLVTHWPVTTYAAADISTRAVAHYRAGLRRAEALREAKLSFIKDTDRGGRTHPMYWASFVLVGVD